MTDIAAFLAVRWDEQERTVPEVFGAPPPGLLNLALSGPLLMAAGSTDGIEYWRYVQADLAAKRAILAMHHPDGGGWDGTDKRCQECGGYELRPGLGRWGFSKSWPCPTVLNLAAPLAWHPDFDPAWAVDLR